MVDIQVGGKLSSDAEKVLSKVSKAEVVDLALALCNIASPVGHEGEVLQFIYDWMAQQGFAPKKIGMLEHRYNVVGTLKGSGKGYTLLTNSHTDTTMGKDETWIQANAADPISPPNALPGVSCVSHTTAPVSRSSAWNVPPLSP